MAKTALFTNFTDQPFTGYWNGKAKTFKPGETLYMPDYLAKHFAKHLTNKELLRTDKSGNLIHFGGDKATSPRVKINKETGEEFIENTLFLSFFNKAYQPDNGEQLGDKEEDIDTIIDLAQKNSTKNKAKKSTKHEEVKTENEVQIVNPPADDDDDFAEKPIDNK